MIKLLGELEMKTDDLDEVDFEEEPHSEPVTEERAIYNTITDIVTGPNIRKKDNVFQAIFILISVILFTAIGGIAVFFSADKNFPVFAGLLMGAFYRLVIVYSPAEFT